MSPSRAPGEVVVAAQPAAGDAFAPFGRVLDAGDRLRLGRHGGVLAVLDVATPEPLRFQELQRYLEVRRLLLPLDGASLLVLVLGTGDAPPGPPAAFVGSPGQGLLIEAGVWHAGPVALAEGHLLEIQEMRGGVDHLDRRPTRDLAGASAIRVRLAPEAETT